MRNRLALVGYLIVASAACPAMASDQNPWRSEGARQVYAPQPVPTPQPAPIPKYVPLDGELKSNGTTATSMHPMAGMQNRVPRSVYPGGGYAPYGGYGGPGGLGYPGPALGGYAPYGGGYGSPYSGLGGWPGNSGWNGLGGPMSMPGW